MYIIKCYEQLYFKIGLLFYLARRLPKRNNLLRLIGLTLSLSGKLVASSAVKEIVQRKMSELSAKNEVSSSKIHKPTDGGQTTLSQDEDTTTTSDVSNDLVISFQNMHTYIKYLFILPYTIFEPL